jgi:carbamoyl-phosphate synthase large subunit
MQHAFRAGFSVDEIYKPRHIDPWFLQQINETVEMEDELVQAGNLAAPAK